MRLRREAVEMLWTASKEGNTGTIRGLCISRGRHESRRERRHTIGLCR